MTPSAVGKLVAKWRGVTVGESSHGHLRKLTATEADVAHVCADELEAALATAPPEQARCPDCDEAAKHAYSDATTPGFFHSKCERHRQPQAATVWIVTQDGRVHSVHASRESAEKEQGENLRVDTAPWAVLQDGKRFMQPTAASAGALDAVALHDESFQLVDKWFVSKCDKAEIPTILLNWKQTMDSLRPLVAAALAAHDQKVREPLAAWMIANSFATGHGDSMEDLLRELKWQVEELRGKVGRVSMVELMEHDQKVREQAKDELIMRHRCGCETCTHTSELCPATKSSIAMERTSLEQRDQKVRAETLEEAAQEVEKLNELWPVTCMDQPYRDAAQAIRSLVAPAPAASKPEAGSKGEK